MRFFRRLFAIKTRADWHWDANRQRPTLAARSPLRPGWYMLSVKLECQQLRCYGLLNGSQGRMLINGKLRKRLVRIKKSTKPSYFEIIGLNGDPVIGEIRLVPQSLRRVNKLLTRKLLALHPRYTRESLRGTTFSQRWRDYNRLLSRKSFSLVGYDEWIERVERPAILIEKEQQKPSPHLQEDGANQAVRFAIWLWGKREDNELCERSLLSLKQQEHGNFQILPSEHQLQATDQQTWVVLLQVGDRLAPHALRRFAGVIQSHEDARILYADEDRVTLAGRRHSPHFKPAWNPDLLYSDPHYSHSWLIRADLCLKACEALAADDEIADPYALALESTSSCVEDQILHLPEILYHRLDQPQETRSSSKTAQSLQRFLHRHQRNVTVTHHPDGGHHLHWALPEPPPLVSVIIATRDRCDLLHCCLTSLAEHSKGNPPSELIIIDNDSQEPDSLSYLTELEAQDHIRVIRRPGKFNYAALNNEGAAHARGELLAFMNNDVEATHSGWLAAMAAQACRPEIGAVGAKLLFPDGTIQHAGVLLGIGGIAGHAHKYFEADADGYQQRLRLAHNLSAVTAATLVIRKSLFQDLGGFDADKFAVNYNDVDLCLRLCKAGYRNLFCPDAVLIHHESKSRGAPTSEQAFAQWQQERESMLERWGALLCADPNYSPHLSLLEENLSITLRPGATIPRKPLSVL
jgi:GT2 family glycosyltransferase